MENEKNEIANSQKTEPAVEEELAVYEKLRRSVTKILGELHEKVNAETISHSMDKAVTELKEAGEHSKQSIAKARETLNKDVASTGKYVSEVSEDTKKHFDHWLDKGGELWREIGKESEYVMDLSRDKGKAFLLNIVNAVSDWSSNFGQKLDESITYKTGEITHGGEFDCLNCEGKIHLKQAGRIPPCPKCSKTEFRRS